MANLENKENKMNLYSITDGILKLLDMTNDDEIDQEFINDTLETMFLALEDKADGYAKAIHYLEDDINVLHDRKQQFNEKFTTLIKRKENVIKGMKSRLMDAMKKVDKKKIETDLFTLSIAKNGGIQKLNYIETELPPEYFKIQYVVDEEKIRRDLANGKEIKSAFLEERGESLRIK